jgi:hypothetical protein
MFLALAYVKPVDVINKFLLLKERILKKFSDVNTSDFFEYFDKTYVGSKGI